MPFSFHAFFTHTSTQFAHGAFSYSSIFDFLSLCFFLYFAFIFFIFFLDYMAYYMIKKMTEQHLTTKENCRCYKKIANNNIALLFYIWEHFFKTMHFSVFFFFNQLFFVYFFPTYFLFVERYFILFNGKCLKDVKSHNIQVKRKKKYQNTFYFFFIGYHFFQVLFRI